MQNSSVPVWLLYLLFLAPITCFHDNSSANTTLISCSLWQTSVASRMMLQQIIRLYVYSRVVVKLVRSHSGTCEKHTVTSCSSYKRSTAQPVLILQQLFSKCKELKDHSTKFTDPTRLERARCLASKDSSFFSWSLEPCTLKLRLRLRLWRRLIFWEKVSAELRGHTFGITDCFMCSTLELTGRFVARYTEVIWITAGCYKWSVSTASFLVYFQVIAVAQPANFACIL